MLDPLHLKMYFIYNDNEFLKTCSAYNTPKGMKFAVCLMSVLLAHINA